MCLELCQISMKQSFCAKRNSFQLFTISAKELHHRCLGELQIPLTAAIISNKNMFKINQKNTTLCEYVLEVNPFQVNVLFLYLLKTSENPSFCYVFRVYKKETLIRNSRSSRPEVFCMKGVLRNFAKFTVKHVCQIFFFNKVPCLRPVTLLKNSLWHRCFPVNFVKFLRTSFFTEHLWWLLLKQVKPKSNKVAAAAQIYDINLFVFSFLKLTLTHYSLVLLFYTP